MSPAELEPAPTVPASRRPRHGRAWRVMLADDHAVVRSGYRRLLELESDFAVVAEAGDGESAYALAMQRTDIDAIVLDLSMPGRSGLDLVRRLALCAPRLAMLIFTMHESPALLRQALALGAHGYVSKSCAPEELVLCLRRVLEGERAVLSADLAARVAASAAASAPSATSTASGRLSARELDVLRLWAEGSSTAAAAQQLGLSTKTVANVLSRLRGKLGLASDALLVHYAREQGVGGG